MERLKIYKDEMELIITRGYIRGNNSVIDVAYEVHKELYPKEILQKNCGACAYRVLQKVYSDFLRWEKIEQAMEIQKAAEVVNGRKSKGK
jgi:hypothetical protein